MTIRLATSFKIIDGKIQIFDADNKLIDRPDDVWDIYSSDNCHDHDLKEIKLD